MSTPPPFQRIPQTLNDTDRSALTAALYSEDIIDDIYYGSGNPAYKIKPGMGKDFRRVLHTFGLVVGECVSMSDDKSDWRRVEKVR